MRKLLALLPVLIVLAMPASASADARQPAPHPTPSAPVQVPAPHRPEVPRMAIKAMGVGNSIAMGQNYETAGDYDLNDPAGLAAWFASWVGWRQEFWERATAAGYSVEMVGSQTNGCGIFPQCHHEGHGAWSSQMMEVSIEGWVQAQHPDVILLHTGTVDALNAPLRADATMRIVALLERIRAVAPNVAVIMPTVPPIADTLTGPESNVSVNQINAALPGIVAAQRAAGQQIVLVRADLTLADLSDGIHPNRSGYHKTAEAMYAGFVEMVPAPAVPPPLPVDPCSLSQRITLTTRGVAADRLQVTIRANGPGNAVLAVVPGRMVNAEASTPALSGAVASLTVHRQVPGPMQVPLVVTDVCGAWQTFVGGGAGSFLGSRPGP